MKFSCQSCRTRYDIKDEKVRGKRVRIRCRKCEAMMEVDGRGLVDEGSGGPADEGGPTRMMPKPQLEEVLAQARPEGPDADAADQDTTRMMSIADLERERRKSARVHSDRRPTPDDEPLVETPVATPLRKKRSDEDGWFAVIDRSQRGPFTLDEMEAEIAAGRITERTYVWREDLGDWKPAQDVATLAERLASTAPLPPPVPKPQVSPPGEPEPLVARRRSFLDEESLEPGSDLDDALLPRGGLDELFDDLSGSVGGADDGEPGPTTGAGTLSARSGGGIASEDPYEAAFREAAADVDPDEEPAPRETTQTFILASGVRKQRSPLRIVAFVLGFVGLFAGLGYLLTVASGADLSGIVPVGSERREALPWESSGGDEAFRERMLGLDRKDAADDEARPPRGRRAPATGGAAETDGERRVRERREAEVAAVAAEQREDLAELYGQADRGTIAVRSRRDDGAKGHDGPAVQFDAENLHRRLAENQSAFENCVQQELRRNPRFRGGRVEMTLTVVPSGVVTGASLADRSLDRSEVGRCITRAARRMMLQSFPGEDPVDVVVPLVLSASL